VWELWGWYRHARTCNRERIYGYVCHTCICLVLSMNILGKMHEINNFKQRTMILKTTPCLEDYCLLGCDTTQPAKSGHTFLPSYTTLFNQIFLGRQLCQGVKVLQHFKDWLCPHLWGVADGLVKPKLITRCTTVCCEHLCTGWAQEVHTTHNRTPS